MSVFYRRHLPHWQVDGAPHFITWRLDGSLPAHVTGEFFQLDQKLDAGETGPLWLKQPPIADLVVKALDYAERRLQLYLPTSRLGCDGESRSRGCVP